MMLTMLGRHVGVHGHAGVAAAFLSSVDGQRNDVEEDAADDDAHIGDGIGKGIGLCAGKDRMGLGKDDSERRQNNRHDSRNEQHLTQGVIGAFAVALAAAAGHDGGDTDV